MQLLVRTPLGKTCCIDCHKTDTIESIKYQIQDRAGFEPHLQQLVFKNVLLSKNGRTVADYALHNLSVIDMKVSRASVKSCEIQVSFSPELRYCITVRKNYLTEEEKKMDQLLTTERNRDRARNNNDNNNNNNSDNAVVPDIIPIKHCSSYMKVGLISKNLSLHKLQHALHIYHEHQNHHDLNGYKRQLLISHETRINALCRDSNSSPVQQPRQHPPLFHVSLCVEQLQLNEKMWILRKMCNGVTLENLKLPRKSMRAIRELYLTNVQHFDELIECGDVLDEERLDSFDSYADVIQIRDEFNCLNKLIVSAQKDIAFGMIVNNAASKIEDELYHTLQKGITVAEIKMAELDIDLATLRTRFEIQRMDSRQHYADAVLRLCGQCYIWSSFTLVEFFKWHFHCRSKNTARTDVDGQAVIRPAITDAMTEGLLANLQKIEFNGRLLADLNDEVMLLCGVANIKLRTEFLGEVKRLVAYHAIDARASAAALSESGMCCGCAVKAVNTSFVPCGHMVYCKPCSALALASSPNCPMCRTPVTTVVTTFYAANTAEEEPTMPEEDEDEDEDDEDDNSDNSNSNSYSNQSANGNGNGNGNGDAHASQINIGRTRLLSRLSSNIAILMPRPTDDNNDDNNDEQNAKTNDTVHNNNNNRDNNNNGDTVHVSRVDDNSAVEHKRSKNMDIANVVNHNAKNKHRNKNKNKNKNRNRNKSKSDQEIDLKARILALASPLTKLQMNLEMHFAGIPVSRINDTLLRLMGIADETVRRALLKDCRSYEQSMRATSKVSQCKKTYLCCVCTTNEVNTAIVPCGHCVYCFDCSQQSLDHTNRCPICRNQLLTIVRTFAAGF